MRKLYIFGLIGLAAIIIGLAWADQMTFTTYYPAPYGVYREMKVNLLHTDPLSVRPIPPPGEETAWEGKFYYDDGTTEYPKGLYCHDGSDWRPVGGGGSLWTSTVNANIATISPADTNARVGIDTTNAQYKLDLSGTGTARAWGIIHTPRTGDPTILTSGNWASANAKEGEIAYSSANEFPYFYDGTAWRKISSTPAGEYTITCTARDGNYCDAYCQVGESLSNCHITAKTGGSSPSITTGISGGAPYCRATSERGGFVTIEAECIHY